MKKNKQAMDRVIDYALCYLNSNWDDWIEEDLGLTNEQFQKIITKFQKTVDGKWIDHQQLIDLAEKS
jgi:hypothetical protein